MSVFFNCKLDSEVQLVYERTNSVIENNSNETIDQFTDSIKVVQYKEFKLVFTEFNKEFNLWYSPKLIVNTDTLLIEGLANENELSISKSPNGNFFVMDNIIKGYVEDGNGEKILHENFTCIIVIVKEAKVIQNLQSECDG